VSLKNAIAEGYRRVEISLGLRPLRAKPSEFRTKTFKYHEFTVYLKYLTEDLKTLDSGPKGAIYLCFEGNHPKKGRMVLPIAVSRLRTIWFPIKHGLKAMRKEMETQT